MGWLRKLDLPARSKRWIPPWLVGLLVGYAAVWIAILLHIATQAIWPGAVPFGFLFPMILIATLLGRWIGGLTCFALGTGVVWQFVLPQLANYGVVGRNAAAVLVMYLMVGGLMLLIAEAYRRTQGRLRDELTAQAWAETERQRVLALELNHRIKNSLATVQAIAAQTLGKSSIPPDELKAFDERLVALGRAHDLLTQTSWQTVSLDRLIAAAIAPFDDGRRFRIAGPPVSLTPRQAIALTLGIHELATNAVKYGALAVSEGFVDVYWRAEHTGFRLRWEERGGPPVAPPTATGFGSRLVRRNLKEELGGTVSLQFRSEGLTCEIVASKLPGPTTVDHSRPLS